MGQKAIRKTGRDLCKTLSAAHFCVVRCLLVCLSIYYDMSAHAVLL